MVATTAPEARSGVSVAVQKWHLAVDRVLLRQEAHDSLADHAVLAGTEGRPLPVGWPRDVMQFVLTGVFP
jgi:hypothetical protein